jgi:hypothetical protein
MRTAAAWFGGICYFHCLTAKLLEGRGMRASYQHLKDRPEKALMGVYLGIENAQIGFSEHSWSIVGHDISLLVGLAATRIATAGKAASDFPPFLAAAAPAALAMLAAMRRASSPCTRKNDKF